MPHFLRPKYTKPIEREYEAWIVNGIELYFKTLGIDYAIRAVSPSEETKWPADEQLDVAQKVVGLQFKQAKLANGTPGFGRLNWSFHQPPGQYQMIQNRPEIFYCLPTFINRDFREQALLHCLFWRPQASQDLTAWYDNAGAKTTHTPLKNEMRWGRFVEGLSSCELGRRVDSKGAAVSFYSELINYVRERQNSAAGALTAEGLYVLAFRLPPDND